MTTTPEIETIPAAQKKPLGVTGIVFTTLFGVILPFITLGIELATHCCAEILFDPIPTVLHALLVALVPVVNMIVIVRLVKKTGTSLTTLGWWHGAAIGVAACYALLFLPFTPIALIGVIFVGIGLLPLSPLLSLIVAIVLRFRLRRLLPDGEPRRIPGLWGGIAIVAVTLLVLETPKLITRAGLQMATSEDPAHQAKGLSLLRTAGNRDQMLRACYSNPGRIGDFVQFAFNELGSRVSEKEAQDIYYRVTGTPFNTLKPPSSPFARGRDAWWMDFDPDVGGNAVQGRIRGLSLNESRVDIVADASGASAYTEWTLVFKNTSPRQQEARAQVVLPPGSVVSRLTLWIDGEEREAAFGGRSQVRQAYQKVVQRRRDPVLVTTCGPDRVLVQCFPVPPNNGTMKIRLGITSPWDLDNANGGLLRLPYFAEYNFNLPATSTSSVWAESRGSLAPGLGTKSLVAEQTGDGRFALRGTFSAADTDKPATIRVGRDGGSTRGWVLDTRSLPPTVVHQTIKTETTEMPKRILVVIDGSQRMRDHTKEVASAIKAFPHGMEFSLILASDSVWEMTRFQPVSESSIKAACTALEQATFAGGCDNVKALERAWDLTAGEPRSVILWVHATQPVEFAGVEGLRQRWERSSGNPTLLSLQVGTGPNVIFQKLDGLASVHDIGRSGDPAADLEVQLGWWNGKERWSTKRAWECKPKAAAPVSGNEVSPHVIRLWAFNEIQRLASSRQESDQAAAGEMAHRYQLVTLVSGAVVLETQQQYHEAGLDPASASSVPTVPEPETWMLLLLGLVIILVGTRRRRTA